MLGERIRQFRNEKGLSQAQLAERLHVVRQTVSKWEKGASVPDAELLLQLARALDVPAERLLDLPPDPAGEQARAELEAARQRLPRQEWSLDCYQVGQCLWTEGFVRIASHSAGHGED